ncbi:serine/threonine-protein kinase [Sphaerisporangium fuscum]|uniref:serine/threonine-protein kinase n=1 Tax=Sphaerisporangium fuscum TaxID=2835868 RepID=UPI001BDC37A8|nr:serine/threonine-protein kinase [Sphaerisporangium fuscum]
MQLARPSSSNTAVSIVWALAPLFTCGVATPFTMGYAAYRRRAPVLAVAALLYFLGLFVLFVSFAAYSDVERMPDGVAVLVVLALFTNWIGGLIHSLAIRSMVFAPRPVPQGSFPQVQPPHAYPQAPYRQASYPPRQAPAPYPDPRRPGPVPRGHPHTVPQDRQPSRPYPQPAPPQHGPYDQRPRHGQWPPQDPRQTPQPHPGPAHTPNPAHTSGPARVPDPTLGARPTPTHVMGHTGTSSPGNTYPSQAGQGMSHGSGSGSTPAGLRNSSTLPTQTPAPLPKGEPDQIGPYRLIGSLGQGGQGAVYLGETPDGARVAIKVLHARLAAETGARQRFLREVEAARRVAPFSTARVIDADISDDRLFIVSEYVEGSSLEQLVREQGPRGHDGLVRLALGTVGALAAIHRAGIVHRDFKPSNVLIGSDGPRVVDFGIARVLDNATATSSGVLGTPAYMSPEQVSGERVGPESDVFSWAATMVFAATGRPAFGEDNIAAVFHRIFTQQPDLSALPSSLAQVVGRCLEKRPENRPTASDVMLAIVH